MYLETLNDRTMPLDGSNRRRYPRVKPDEFGRFDAEALAPEFITIREDPPPPKNPWMMAVTGAVVGAVASAALFMSLQSGNAPDPVQASNPPAAPRAAPWSATSGSAAVTNPARTVRPQQSVQSSPQQPAVEAPQTAVPPPAQAVTAIAVQDPAPPPAEPVTGGDGLVVMAGPEDDGMLTVWSNEPDSDPATMLVVQQ